uniref:Uncharacterized protein n=1 Tax=Geobacter metallireducens TaxID=28232 RepID=A0A831XFQ2_GEOME
MKQEVIKALQLLEDVAREVGDGSIERYFDGFKNGSGTLYEYVLDIVEAQDSVSEHEAVMALFGVYAAINHDPQATAFFERVQCDCCTKGMEYPKYLQYLLEKCGVVGRRVLAGKKMKHFQGIEAMKR